MSHLPVGNMVLERMAVIWPLPKCMKLAEHLISHLWIPVEHCATQSAVVKIKLDTVQMPSI